LSSLTAFAGNSILCRMALGTDAIDAYSFTAVRLGSGALTLLLLTVSRRPPQGATNGSWTGAFFLALYALPFSMAYIRLETGAGALLLFASVQLTMIGSGLRSGERLSPLQWLGFAGALSGVIYLVSPGLSAPDPLGATLMIAAGASWGAYSITGKTAGDPALATAGNFRRASLLIAPVVVLAWPWLSLSNRGFLLAVASGALASGVGYTIWYTALKYLSVTRAALVQLSVPVIAAAGGILFLGESITLRLLAASAVILGSVVLAIADRRAGAAAHR
jgi:drug/metabolite transporter (DMT)-like permease